MQVKLVRILEAQLNEEEFETVLVALGELRYNNNFDEIVKNRAALMYSELEKSFARDNLAYDVSTD